MTKICTMCKQDLPITEYYTSKTQKSGYWPSCKTCTLASKKASRERHPTTFEQRKAYVQKYKSRHPDRVKASYRKQSLRKNFGITPEEYDSLLLTQNGVCAACHEPPGKKMLAVDHCHTKGHVRGLLCGNCNTAAGLLKEDRSRFESLMEYLNI